MGCVSQKAIKQAPLIQYTARDDKPKCESISAISPPMAQFDVTQNPILRRRQFEPQDTLRRTTEI
ncbi:hypothetical protein pb186bvf_020461 [Paramecium bursaria]